MKERDTIGLAEAAQKLGLPYQSAHRLLLTGELQGEKRGSRWVVSLPSLTQYQRNHTDPHAAVPA